MIKARIQLAPALLVVFILSACSSVQEPNPTTVFPFPRMAPTEPPAPIYEPEPENQQPRDMIWRPGYWNYNNGQFQWIEGHLMQRPDPTAVWEPDRWDKRAYGWVFVPGTWW